MAYVHRLINDDEKLIGIARLHWIYILQGLFWFVGMAGAGLAMSWLMNRGMAALTGMGGDAYVPAPIIGLSSGVLLFMLAAGAMIFLFYVIKVLATQIALTDRRIIQKKGLIFVNVHQIDLEEIRGENMDLGIFGRLLGYAYIMLDCRFIGDITLDAIEQPERFIRALHDRRVHAQDAINLVVGKSPVQRPIKLIDEEEAATSQQKPEVEPPKPPEPEIQPPTPDDIPPPPNHPMPDAPPPLDKDKAAFVEDGKMKAEMSQRIEKLKLGLMEDLMVNKNNSDTIKAPESLAHVRARGGKEMPVEEHQTPDQISAENLQNRSVTKQEIAKIVEELTPQIKDEVVREMTEQGLIKPPAAQNDNGVDNDLIHVFDDAALDKDGTRNDNRNTMEHAIH